MEGRGRGRPPGSTKQALLANTQEMQKLRQQSQENGASQVEQGLLASVSIYSSSAYTQIELF